MLFQILQFSFGSILLFDIPKNLLDIFLEYIIISKYILGYIPSRSNNLSFNCFVWVGDSGNGPPTFLHQKSCFPYK
jgi:hypothetical protein